MLRLFIRLDFLLGMQTGYGATDSVNGVGQNTISAVYRKSMFLRNMHGETLDDKP